MRKVFWFVGNTYGKLFGWSFLAGWHHAIINLSLHALGYGNSYRESFTGEAWFIRTIIKPTNPKVVVDVGANVGKYSLMLLRETNAKIYAIEPNPYAYEKLCNLPDRIVKLRVAISDHSGEETLYFKSEFDERATLAEKSDAVHKKLVPVKTLKEIIFEHDLEEIDLLKIDTEGFEREVLLGLGSCKPKYIQFEFNIDHLHRNCTLLQLTQLLPDYDFYRLLANGWIKIDPEKYLNNIFMFSNVIAKKGEGSK